MNVSISFYISSLKKLIEPHSEYPFFLYIHPMCYKLVLFICSIAFLSCNQNNEPLKVSFTGDVMLDRGINDQLRLYGDSLLIHSFSSFKESDAVIINLEGTLTDSDSAQNDTYNFQADKHKAEIIRNAGVTHFSVANNHSCDYGKKGFENTIDAVIKSGAEVLGSEYEPKLITKKTYTCAVLSVSLTSHNEHLPISSVSELKQSVSSFIDKNKTIPFVLYIHWGLELQSESQQWQKELARELIEMGVDAIIGHHPHVVQQIEFIHNKPVLYSIGNFIADAYLPDSDFCYTVEMNITDSIESIFIQPQKLKRYFSASLTKKEQLEALKKHLRFSNVGLVYKNNKWEIKAPEKMDFTENSGLWMFAEKNTVSAIKKLHNNSYLLQFQKSGESANVLNLHGALSEFQIGDINNDNKTDVLIGISKKVRFDSAFNKRINIYTFDNKALEPLWLGTKFINDVVSFDIINEKHKNYLTTVEQVDSVTITNRIYEWDDFGFGLYNKNENSQN